MMGERSSRSTRHEQPRHEREVKIHVAFIAVAEILGGVFRPLIRLGQQHAIAEVLVDVCAHVAQEGVRLWQVFAVRAFALVEIGNRVQPQAVDSHPEPEVEHGEHRLANFGIVEVQIGLMTEEAVPVVGAGDRVPAPIGRLEVLKDDSHFADTCRACRSTRTNFANRNRPARRDR